MSSEQHLYVGVPADAPHDPWIAKQMNEARRGDIAVPWQPVLTAIFLFFIGLIFWPVGIYLIFHDYDRGVSFIVIGVITFIPGSYSMWHLVQTWRGKPGYRYKNMPGRHQD